MNHFKKLLISVAATGVIFAPSVYGYNNRDLKDLGFEILKQEAPDFSYTDSSGKSFSLSANKGKAVFLHFWATWCIPCQKEIPDLSRLAEKLKDKNLELLFISVNKESERAKAESFLHQIDPNLKAFIIKDSPTAEKYISWGIPVTYLINTKGKITARAMGSHDWSAIPINKMQKIVNDIEQ